MEISEYFYEFKKKIDASHAEALEIVFPIDESGHYSEIQVKIGKDKCIPLEQFESELRQMASVFEMPLLISERIDVATNQTFILVRLSRRLK